MAIQRMASDARRWAVLAATLGLTALSTGCAGEVIQSEGAGERQAGRPRAERDREREPTGRTQERLCGSGTSGAALAWTNGNELMLTRPDGTTFTAHTFTKSAPSSDVPIAIQVSSRAGFIAAQASVFDTQTPQSEAVILDREGNLLWRSESFAGFGGIQVGASGVLTIGLTETGALLVVTPTGEERTFAKTQALGPETAGRIPVRVGDDWPGAMGWLDITTGTVEPLAFAIASGDFPRTIRDGLAYVTETGLGHDLVIDRPQAVSTVALDCPHPIIDAAAMDGFAIVKAGASWGTSGAEWVAGPESGEIAELAMPTDVYPFGYAYYDGASVWEGGELLLPARDAEGGGLYRSADAGTTWELIGSRFTEIQQIGYASRGGTYLVMGSDELGYFPSDGWAPAELAKDVDRVGPSAFAARPDDGIVRELPAALRSPTLTEDGMCIAYHDDDGLAVADVARDVTVRVAGGPPADVGTIVWVE